MGYVRSAKAQKLFDRANTKLICYYFDGNARTYAGRNHLPGGRTAADPYALELLRHQRYVKKEAHNIRTALIYDLSTGEEVHKFSKGSWL